MPTIAAFEFLKPKREAAPAPVCVVFGDELFLRRAAIQRLREAALGEGDAEFSFTRFSGGDAVWQAVHDEISTRALFGGSRRVVLVDDANDFVSDNRASLEQYVTRAKGPNVLILSVGTWAKNTKLFKLTDEHGLQIDCATPSRAALQKWLPERTKAAHGAVLSPAAAEALLDLAGDDLGLIDQELAKTAAFAGEGNAITPEMIHDLVGGWRMKTTWEMLDAALAGEAAEALRQLDRLLGAGEAPLAVMGAVGYTMRQMAAAVRLVEQSEAAGRRVRLGDMLAQAGVKPFKLRAAEAQLRQLGRRRAGQFYRWLLEADLDMKGRSQLDARTVLERLIARMSKQAA